MQIKEYITAEEVQKVCKEINISDWSAISDAKVLIEDAKIILSIVNAENMTIDPEQFRLGLEVELEHGTRFKDANVTNNHPIVTGKIVMAHMKETLDYYKRLDVMELEGDLLEAIYNKNIEKIEDKYKKLVKARHILTHVELDKFKEKH